jgi:hypothetical protein
MLNGGGPNGDQELRVYARCGAVSTPQRRSLIGNSIEGPQPAVFMPEKLASGISAGKVKFLLMAFSAVAVRWIWA